MLNTQDEKNAAEEAEGIIHNLSISASPSQVELAVQSLRKANDAAITAAGVNPLAQEQLNGARAEAAIALSAVIDQVNNGALTEDAIDRARRAVKYWKSRVA